MEKGRERIGRWLEASVNVLEDYRKAFGKDPPETAALAVMSDTDNAGGSAVAYLDFIEVGKEKP
jgi:Ca2+-binding EF-hand superfamily protein